MADEKDRVLTIDVPLDACFETAKRALIDAFEEAYLVYNFSSSELNVSETSRRTGISRKHLRTLLRRHEIRNKLGVPDRADTVEPEPETASAPAEPISAELYRRAAS